MAGKSKTEELSFEQNLARLQSLVDQMEASELPLEDLIRFYEEGIQLVKVCSEKLDSAEKRIQLISRKASGELVTEDFSEEKTRPAALIDPPMTPAPEAKHDEISLF